MSQLYGGEYLPEDGPLYSKTVFDSQFNIAWADIKQKELGKPLNCKQEVSPESIFETSGPKCVSDESPDEDPLREPLIDFYCIQTDVSADSLSGPWIEARAGRGYR